MAQRISKHNLRHRSDSGTQYLYGKSLPFAEAQGYLADEDVFKSVS